ncbi:hypothetical protein ACWCQE_27795 [Streptomyces sp. NPDC002409]
MAVITAEMQKAANVIPARCGKGKGVHYATAGRDLIGILCGYRSLYGARPLTDAEAAKPGKECTRCVAAVGRILAEAAEGAAASVDKQAAAHRPQEPTRYLADYEIARTDDGDRVHRITVTRHGSTAPELTRDLPYDPDRNAASTLESLGWKTVGMETYGGPHLFRAIVEPIAQIEPDMTPEQARAAVTATWFAARDFHPWYDKNDRLRGYTFAAEATPNTRYGWVTAAGTYSRALEPYRSYATEMLPAAVLDDERRGNRLDPAVQRAAALAAQREKAAADRAAHRAEMDDRTAAEAAAHGAPVPPAVAARIAARASEQERPTPFGAGDRIVCADGRTRTALGMAPKIADEPDRVVVEGGAQWLAADCEPAREVEIAPARKVMEGVSVQHGGATEGCAPRDVEHPDVLAARRALAGLAVARLTDHHDVMEPTEEERQVRGYMVEPRGQGRVAIYWLEGGAIIRRDTPLHGAALDCLEDRMRREGWETERMGRSAQCLFAHVPQTQHQG